MNQERQTIKRENFKVLCICCGGKIRDDERENASRQCLNCFYQLFSKQMQTQKTTGAGEFVSER